MRTPPHRRMSRRAAIFDRVHVDDRPAPLQSQRPHSRSSMPPRYVFGVPAGLVLRLRPGFSRSSAAKPRFANLKTSPQFAQRTDPRPQRHDPLALPASKPHLGTSTHGRPADPRRTTSASASRTQPRVLRRRKYDGGAARKHDPRPLAVQPRNCELKPELTDLTQILSFCSEAAQRAHLTKSNGPLRRWKLRSACSTTA